MLAFVVVPGRDLVAPPELARDAPRLDVLEPLEIGLLPVLRHEPRLARAHGGKRPLGEGLHVHVPLVGEIGLDHRAGAVAVRHRVRVRLDRDENAASPPAARRRACAPRSGRARRGPAPRPTRRRRGRVGEEILVAVERDLRLGPEHVDRAAVRAAAPTSKSLKSCAGVILTAPVPFSGSEYSSATIGMRRPTSGRMAYLPTRSRKRSSSGCTATATSPSIVSGRVVATVMKRPRLALDRVADVPEDALDLDLLDLEIRDRGLELRVPVDQALVLVDRGPRGRGRRRP